MATTNSRAKIGGRSLIDLAIETLWLTGLVLVPLAFRGREFVAFFSQPKYFVLHFVALAILALWTLEWALSARQRRSALPGSVFDRVEAWLAREPGRWAIFAAGGFAFALIASTLLSPQPMVSVWGRDFGELGQEFYSSASYLVVFAAIALRMRSRAQAFRMAYALAGVAAFTAVYGVSQHYGWDPIGREEGASRVISTLGNPLFFGSYLVLTLPVTVALAAWLGVSRGTPWLAAGIALAGVQFAALWFTGGRGPWLGAFVGFAVFGLMAWRWLDRRHLRAAAVTVAGGLAIAIVAASISVDANRGARGFGDLLGIPGEIADTLAFVAAESGAPAAGPAAPPVATPGAGLSSAVATVEPGSPPADDSGVPSVAFTGNADLKSDALSGRAGIWRAGLELAVTRDGPFGDSTLEQGLRHVFGYGPDMYFYAHPYGAIPQGSLTGVTQAHNYMLQVWLELGLAGVVAIMLTVGLAFAAALRVLRRRTAEPWVALFMTGALAALAGRAVDQSSNVGRMSDLALTWLLIGFVLALTEIGRRDADPVVREPRRRAGAVRLPAWRLYAPMLAFLAVAALGSAIFVIKDVQPLRAGWVAANAFENKALGQNEEAFRGFQRAADLAPDVERYVLEIDGFLTRTAQSQPGTPRALELYRASYDALSRYEDRDHDAWSVQLALAATTQNLVAAGDATLLPELGARYTRIAELMPVYPRITRQAAEVLALAGESENALKVAELALRTESIAPVSPAAAWARADALRQLGRNDESRTALESVIERFPDGSYAARSHRGLALLAQLEGDNAAAEFHLRKAEELES